MLKLGRNIPGMLRNLSYRSAPWVPAPSTSSSTPPFKFRPGLLITATVLGTPAFLYWIDYRGIRTKYGRPLSVEECERNLDELITRNSMIKEMMLELRTTYAASEKSYAAYEKEFEEGISSLRSRIAEMKAKQLQGHVGGSYYVEGHVGQDDV